MGKNILRSKANEFSRSRNCWVSEHKILLGERKELFCGIVRTSVSFYHPKGEFCRTYITGFFPLIKVTEFEVPVLSEIISYSSISTKRVFM